MDAPDGGRRGYEPVTASVDTTVGRPSSAAATSPGKMRDEIRWAARWIPRPTSAQAMVLSFPGPSSYTKNG